MVEASQGGIEEKGPDKIKDKVKMKILVTGAAGFLGTKAMKLLADDFELVGTDKEDSKGCLKMDITKKEEVDFVVGKTMPDIILHIAAMADVDGCEEHKELANRINVLGTKNIAEACKKINAKVISFSTDFVFDGRKGNYKEDDFTNPLSYYARTKLDAENIVKKSGVKYIIIRPEVLYGYNGDGSERSFVNWAYQNMKEGKEIKVVDDQFNTPTLIDDIANAVAVLIKKGREGIYHVAGPERLSRHEMAAKIAKVFGLDASFAKPIKSSELKQKAKRPVDSSLNTEKLKREGIIMHDFEEGLRIMKRQMRA